MRASYWATKSQSVLHAYVMPTLRQRGDTEAKIGTVFACFQGMGPLTGMFQA